MTTPVVVIGAGPYGLSTAAHLRARGVPVRIFGSPMVSWREHMPAGMLLKSTPVASNISAARPGHTLQDFCRAVGEKPLVTDWDIIPSETFVRYGKWFQEQLLPDLEQVRVVSVDRREGAAEGFHLKLDSGEQLQARAVVVATGLIGFAYTPGALHRVVPDGPSAAGPVSHSSQHTDLARFSGREVAVIGAGQSALETAALLVEEGARVRLLARRQNAVGFGDAPDKQSRLSPETPFGRAWSLYAFSYYAAAFRYLPAPLRLSLVRRVLGPLGAWWLRDRFEGKVEVSTGHDLRGVRLDGSGKVVLSTSAPGGRAGEFTADHVLAATGYRVGLEALGFLGPELRARLVRTGGSPRLGADFCSTVPGLYFTGLPAAATFGPLMRFVCGTDWAAPRLAAAVARG